jgi:hypothetical protein
MVSERRTQSMRVSTKSTLIRPGAVIILLLAATTAVVAPDDPGTVWLDLAAPAQGVRDVHLVDDHAVLATVRGVEVLDISDPTAPEVVGTLELSAEATRIQVHGDLAAVAFDWGKIALVDLSTLTAPRLLASVRTGGRVNDISLAGDLLAVARSDRVVVYSVSRPANPEELASIVVEPEGLHNLYASAAVLDPPHLFTFANTPHFAQRGWSALAGLVIWDLTNPAQPSPVQSQLHGWFSEMRVSGDLLANGIFRLELVDISNPTDPSELMVWEDHFWVRTFDIDDGTAFLSNAGELVIIDIEPPTDPQQLAALDVGFEIHAVDVLGDTACLLGPPDSGEIALVDVADPTAPELLSVTTVAGAIRRIDIHNQLIGVTETRARLTLIDGSEPSAPAVVSTIAGDYSDAVFGLDLLYAGKWDSTCNCGQLEVRDLSDPSSPSAVHLESPFAGYWRLASHSGQLLAIEPHKPFLGVVPVESDGLMHLWDLSQPPLPHYIGRTALAISDGWGYQTDYYNAIHVIESMETMYAAALWTDVFPKETNVFPKDTSDRDWQHPPEPPLTSHPFRATRLFKVQHDPPYEDLTGRVSSELTIGGSPTGIVQAPDAVIVTTREDGLTSWIAEDQGRLHRAAQLQLAGRPSCVAVRNTTALVGLDAPALAIVDLRDPVRPMVTGEIPLRRTPLDLAVDPIGGVVWSAAGTGIEGVELSLATCAGVTVDIEPADLVTNGGPAEVTATLTDPLGRPLAGEPLRLATTLGSLTAVVDSGDGTYGAQLWPDKVSGSGQVHVELDGTACSGSATAAPFEIKCAFGAVQAPHAVVAAGVDEHAVEVSWQSADAAAGFRIWRDGNELAEIDGSARSFVDSTLEDLGHHCYWVQAVDACDGVSPRSRQACAVPSAHELSCLAIDNPRPIPMQGPGYGPLLEWDGLVLESRDDGMRVWQPRPDGSLELHGHLDQPLISSNPRGVVRSDPRTLLLWGREEIQVVDMTSPRAPVLLAQLPLEALVDDPDARHIDSVAACPGVAAVEVHRSYLVVVDLSNPQQPVVASLEDGLQALSKAIVVDRGIAWLEWPVGELVALDVTNPYQPEIVSTTPLPTESVGDGQVTGDILWLLAYGSLMAVSIEDPHNPQLVSTLPVSGSALDVHHDTAWISTYDRWSSLAHLAAVDVAQPQTPVITMSRDYEATSNPKLAVTDRFAYLRMHNLLSVDIHDADWRALEIRPPIRSIELLDIIEGIAIVRTSSSTFRDQFHNTRQSFDTLETWHVPLEGDPARLGRLEVCCDGGYVANGETAYVGCIGTNDTQPSVHVVDLSTLSEPTHVAAFQCEAPPERLALTASDVLAVLAHRGIQTFGLSGGGAVPEAAGWWPAGWQWEVEAHATVADNLLVVGAHTPHLWSLDLSSPSDPRTDATVRIADHPEARVSSARMARTGDLVALGCGGSSQLDESRLLLLDVEDPDQTSIIAEVPDFTNAADLLAVGSTVIGHGYLGYGQRELVSLDVSDPTSTSILSRQTLPDYIDDLARGANGITMLTNNHLATVHLECRPPAAEIGVATAGRLARLSDASWYGPDESYWDLGDGTLATGSTVLHTFPEPGWYDIALESFNDHGGDRTTIRLPVGCDLDHDRAVTGDDVAHLVAELFDGDGTSASHAWAGSHRGAIDYDIDETGEIALEDLMRLLPLIRSDTDAFLHEHDGGSPR